MRRTTHSTSRRAALALAVGLGAIGGVRAQAAGDIVRVGDTQVSAMVRRLAFPSCAYADVACRWYASISPINATLILTHSLM